eukprot:CAMPEP_0201594240 /NCGR_PEP_ID=MMETSP0190_2-20130828/191615_1 /ASSEMBLY_ACC=CAM_ASM_000263 /TAXON_ID=37353 /ORGANISM="Rosalina sp." /LENGTH=158 /DNA_ID=CAMNT_0048053771 /DNA_START=447 /DNA_END=920 /DNA_ORIENTATION=-
MDYEHHDIIVDDNQSEQLIMSRNRSGSMGTLLDIDLVSNHKVSQNRFWARSVTSTLYNNDQDEDDEDEDEDEDDLEPALTESVTSMTPQSDDSFSFSEGINNIIQFDINEQEEDYKDEEKADKYNIIGHEKVNFDPFTSEATYDPKTGLLIWSNGTKW